MLTLEGLKTGLGQFESQRAAAPILIGGAFILFYVAVTALSLPGATIMTLADGALFGTLLGLDHRVLCQHANRMARRDHI